MKGVLWVLGRRKLPRDKPREVMSKNEWVIPALSKVIKNIPLGSVRKVNMNVIISTVLNIFWPLKVPVSSPSLGVAYLVLGPVWRNSPWNTTEQLDNKNQSCSQGSNYLVCHWGMAPKRREETSQVIWEQVSGIWLQGWVVDSSRLCQNPFRKAFASGLRRATNHRQCSPRLRQGSTLAIKSHHSEDR